MGGHQRHCLLYVIRQHLLHLVVVLHEKVSSVQQFEAIWRVNSRVWDQRLQSARSTALYRRSVTDLQGQGNLTLEVRPEWLNLPTFFCILTFGAEGCVSGERGAGARPGTSGLQRVPFCTLGG